MCEPLDANKTALTHTANATVAAWLLRIGAKPIETEVPITDGWNADLAAAWCPTVTEAKIAKLIQRAGGTWTTDREQMARRFREVGGLFTIAVEVKTSRSDLMKDAGRKYRVGERHTNLRPAAHYCILACPASIAPEIGEFDSCWGILRLAEDCTRAVKSDLPWHANPMHASEIQSFLYSLAVRCEHRSRYLRMRTWLKSHRAIEAVLAAKGREQ